MATIKDLKRMCENMTCKDCPLSGGDVNDCWVMQPPDSYPDEDIDEIVDKWIEEHPVKTYTMDFFEKFPNARTYKEIPTICLRDIHPELGDECYGKSCLECWNREMKEK